MTIETTYGDLYIPDEFDKYGELEINVEMDLEDSSIWLDKKEVNKLIEHLIKVNNTKKE